MKHIVLALAAAFLAGCAAPPPVKIASKLIGRSVLNEAKDGLSGSGNDQDNNP